MSGTIALLSGEPPKKPKALTKEPIHCFSEIEALLAFMQYQKVNTFYLDKSLQTVSSISLQKYLALIKQSYPDVKIVVYSSEEKINKDCVNYIFYPNLETMFRTGELLTKFQPIVLAKKNDHKIIGFECLARLRLNDRYLSPDFFFQYAQEKLQLGNYDKICIMQALDLAPRIKNIAIFINIRPQTLVSDGFYAWFKEQLKKRNIAPGDLVVELTEQNCVISEKRLSEQCHKLKSLGLSFAIDDFGCGVSNLSAFEIIKPEYLKIPGRFIKGIASDSSKQKIVKNILDLSSKFKVITIVENVETKEEWEYLLSLGLNLAQGYYFYKPISKEEMLACIAP